MPATGTFTPPATVEGPRHRYDKHFTLADRLMRHYVRPHRADTVYLYTDGTVGTTFPPPAWTDSTVDPWSLVTRAFYGARTHTVNATEEAALEAGGYTVDSL